jgi:hypothetical protein
LVVLATEAAKKLVEWCYKKVTEKKVGDPPLEIRVSGQVVVIVNGADPRTIESQLQSLLRIGT